jgi:hypothetical protein
LYLRDIVGILQGKNGKERAMEDKDMNSEDVGGEGRRIRKNLPKVWAGVLFL